WLSRIDRVMRLNFYWGPEDRRRAVDAGLLRQPLQRLPYRFPVQTRPGDYVYVFTFGEQTLWLVGRMRITRFVEWVNGAYRGLASAEGCEGTPIRFDLAVPLSVLPKIAWYAGKEERRLRLDETGRLVTQKVCPWFLEDVRRLTPVTAQMLDELLSG